MSLARIPVVAVLRPVRNLLVGGADRGRDLGGDPAAADARRACAWWSEQPVRRRCEWLSGLGPKSTATRITAHRFVRSTGPQNRNTRGRPDWVAVATAAAHSATHLPNPQRHADALTILGLALVEVRRFEEAITAHEQAVTIFGETGDRHGEGMALNNLALALAQVRRFEEAITAHEQDLAICRETGDRHGEGMALNNLGVALVEAGSPIQARIHWTQAHEAFIEIGATDDANAINRLLDDYTAPHDQ
jgi:tetratricopeptide (TPR) repeat protein